jgi:hypothetical protein
MKYFKWVFTNEANVKIVKFDHNDTPIEAFGKVKDALKYFIDFGVSGRSIWSWPDPLGWKEISESQYNAIKNLYTNT